jgi:ATP-dependent helicase/nuclease subunit A
MMRLTEEQQSAIEARGPVCLTASAGSGKTAVLVSRYLRLIDQGVRPNEILTVTFTRKSGKELKERLAKALEDAPDALKSDVESSPWIGTLHSFCLHVIQQWGRALPERFSLDVADSLIQAELVSETIEEWMRAFDDGLASRAFEKWTPSDLKALAAEALARPHAVREALAELKPTPENGLLTALLTPLLEFWKRRLIEKALCTFDDLEHYAKKLLTEHAPAQAYYQKQFRAVLVDEIQDTNPSQWAILHALLGSDASKLFVVGDPKQSIYRFRYADLQLFLQWSQLIETLGGTSLALRACFRSSSELVEQINAFSTTLFADSPLARTTLLPGKPASGKPPLSWVRYEGDTSGEAQLAEQQAAIEVVRTLVAGGTPTEEMALLFRSSDRMELFARALSDARVPVAFEPSVPLFSHYETLDLESYLKTVSQPRNNFYLAGFLRSSFVGKSVAELQSLLRTKPVLWDALESDPSLEWFRSLVEAKATNPRKALMALFSNTQYWPSRSGPLYAVLGSLFEAETLSEACARMDAWKREGVKIATPLVSHEPNGVRLLTVHAAKGLEFDHVLLVDLLRKAPTRQPWLCGIAENSLGFRYRLGNEIVQTEAFTQSWEKSKKEDADESRRVLYVALTRAKERLHIFLPQNAKLIPKESWGEWLKGMQLN